MELGALLDLDTSLRSTMKVYETFLRECLHKENYKHALALLDRLTLTPSAIVESDFCVLAVATWAQTGAIDKALRMVRRAKRFGFRRFYYFDPAWGSYGFRRNPASGSWEDNKGRNIHDGSQTGELHRYLLPIFQDVLVQDYVQGNFSIHLPTEGFDIETTPLCWVKRTKLGRKRAKCEASGKRIEKGEDVLELRYFNGSFDIPTTPFVMLPGEGELGAASNLERYEKDAYQFAEFKLRHSYRNPMVCAFWQADSYSLSGALDLIANPSGSPTPYAFHDVEGNRIAGHEPMVGAGTAAELIDLLWVVVKCGYLDEILEKLNELPPYFPLLLMLFDRREIRVAVSERMQQPELVRVYETIGKSRLNAKDIAYLSSYGRDHPDFQSALAESLSLYEYHLYSNYRCSPNWFFRDFSYFARARGRHFLYVLASRPSLMPSLEGMKERKRLIGPSKSSEGIGYDNVRDAFYGTVLLNCQICGDPDHAFWQELPGRVRYGADKLQKTRKLVNQAARLLS